MLLHGFEGSPKKNFFPWLARELEKRGHSVEAPTLPKTKNPDIEKQVHHVLDTCHFTENTILVGHSLGGVVGQIITERLKTPIKKMVLVGSFTKPNFLDSKDQPFVDTFSWNLDLEKVRDNARRIVILHDQNDPIIPTREADILAEATAGELRSVVARKEHFCGPREPEILNACLEEVRVFTTRPDTIYGVTYMVLAPEHALVNELQSNITNWQEVTQYQKEANKKTQLERTAQDRAKSGVQLEGIYAKNPANGEEIPVYIADYVMTGYGTGAIMAVPAHDERDWEFAKVYGLPIRQVIRPVRVDTTNPPRKGAKVSPRYVVHCIVKHPSEDTVVTLRWKEHDWQTLIIGGIEKGESPEEAARREIYEETGYKNLILEDQLGDEVRAEFYAAHKEVNRIAYTKALVFRLSDLEKDDVTEEEKAKHEPVWTPIVDLEKTLRPCAELDLWIHRLKTGNYAYSGKGELVNSGGWDGMSSDHVQDLITQTASGVKRVTYRLNDWVFSRQRYWGEPIPLVHCEHCGVVPVPEKDLPVELPNVKKYEPTGTGESPLAAIDSWVNTTCPECGEKAKRETNTMPQWAGSCWYYLRYIDPSNTKQLVSEKKERHWMPVDMYVGGVEHATRHLIYARFWHKFLYDIDAVSTTEPFATLKNQGMIAGPDGRKMSKRYGNIINPDDVIKQHGADSFRTYEMFMGPFDQGGGWNTDNLIGVRRFLEKVWRLQEKVQDETTHTKTETDKKIEIRMHQTIQKVTEDIETFSFNTAISALMVLANQLDKQENIDRSVYTVLVQLLAPLAPHMCEELWLNVLKNKISVHTSDWPVYDETKLVEDTVTIVIQVNGKVRDEFEINKDMPGAEVIAQAKARDAVKRWVGDSKVAREIYVPGKLVSIATDTK
ncbi:MAG: alpha/beta fold hydrolase [Candidatus Paceibacterota bacterium]